MEAWFDWVFNDLWLSTEMRFFFFFYHFFLFVVDFFIHRNETAKGLHEIFVATDAETFFLENVQSLPFGVAVKTGDQGPPLFTAAVISFLFWSESSFSECREKQTVLRVRLSFVCPESLCSAFQCCSIVFDGYSLSH